MHGGQVPHITHDGPGCHHHQQVGDHGHLGAVPEGISEFRIILDSHRVYHSTNLERALLELHYAGVINARPLRKYEYGELGRILDMISQPVKHIGSVFRLAPLKPDL